MQPKKPVPAVRPDKTARPIRTKTDRDIRGEEETANKELNERVDMFWWPNRDRRPSGPLSDVEKSDSRIGKAARRVEAVKQEKEGRFRDREHWAKAMFEGYEEPSQGIADDLMRAVKKAGFGAGRTEEEARASLKGR